MKQNKKFVIWSFLAVIAVFALIKIYVVVFESNFHDLNITNIEKIEKQLDRKDSFSLAVIGNIENSIDFAPSYAENHEDEKNIIRCKPFFQYRRKNFVVPVTNIFSTRIKKEFQRIRPDIVHLHHPYWLGSVGLKLAKKHQIASVYTYHTRLTNTYPSFAIWLVAGYHTCSLSILPIPAMPLLLQPKRQRPT